MAVPADLAVLLDKDWEAKTLSEVLAAPVSALAGVTDSDAALLKQAFGIDTVAELGINKYFRAAHALTSLAELGAKYQPPGRRPRRGREPSRRPTAAHSPRTPGPVVDSRDYAFRPSPPATER